MFEAFKNLFQKTKQTVSDSFQKAEISFEETSSESNLSEIFEPSIIVPEKEQKDNQTEKSIIKTLKNQVKYRKEASYRSGSQKNQ